MYKDPPPGDKCSSPRDAALFALSETFEKSSHPEGGPPSGGGPPPLEKSFRKYSLDSRDRRLAMELVYGVLRNLLTLDHSLSFFLKDADKVQPELRDILRLASYQLLYLDKIPARAAVDEAVKQAKRFAGKGAGGFVNAVLRNLLRAPDKVKFPDPERQPAEYLSLRLSYPAWLVERWVSRLGFDGARALMEAGNSVPPIVLRANAPDTGRDELARLFMKEGLDTEPGEFAHYALVLNTHRPVRELPGYGEGLFSVQDEAAQLVSELVAPEPGEFILDACAAPGGKSAHLSSISSHGAFIVSLDISLDKLRVLKENNLRLKCGNIFPAVADAAGGLPFKSKFDRALVDAPCTALGIIRRRPEIKYKRQPGDIARMAAIQLSMLENIAGYIKPGGVIVYSVCSTEPEEGEGVLDKFLSRYTAFELEDPAPFLPEAAKGFVNNKFIRTFPHLHGTDGFFMARMKCR